MAKKAKTKKAASSSDDNVVRIKAGAAAPKKPKAHAVEAVAVSDTAVTDAKPEKKAKTKKARSTKGIRGAGALKATGDYFKGAWVELRQVHWPNRRATCSLTGAVLLYSAFFVVLVLLLDAGFKYLFELILGK